MRPLSILAKATLLCVFMAGNSRAGTYTVPATANIFASGLATNVAPGGGGGGTLPVLVSLSSSQGGAFQFQASGSISQYYSYYYHSADGWLGAPANINPYGGISGYLGSTTLPLVGVFLSDAVPAAPPPATLDFKVSGLGMDFTNLSPVLGQLFFIGDGQASGGMVQTFVAPAGATRLYLGYADAPQSVGDPGGYGDNYGELTVTVSPVFVNEPPVADATATQRQVIACNPSNAPVVLDGSKSYDADGDPLQYSWYVNGAANPSATGEVASVVLPVGTNFIRLSVSDGVASSDQTIAVRVLTSQQAVEELILRVVGKVVRYRPLVATLAAAHDSIDRGDYTPAINQMHAFQLKVHAQVAPLNPVLAKKLNRAAEDIIVALECSLTGGQH